MIATSSDIQPMRTSDIPPPPQQVKHVDSSSSDDEEDMTLDFGDFDEKDLQLMESAPPPDKPDHPIVEVENVALSEEDDDMLGIEIDQADELELSIPARLDSRPIEEEEQQIPSQSPSTSSQRTTTPINHHVPSKPSPRKPVLPQPDIIAAIKAADALTIKPPPPLLKLVPLSAEGLHTHLSSLLSNSNAVCEAATLRAETLESAARDRDAEINSLVERLAWKDEFVEKLQGEKEDLQRKLDEMRESLEEAEERIDVLTEVRRGLLAEKKKFEQEKRECQSRAKVNDLIRDDRSKAKAFDDANIVVEDPIIDENEGNEEDHVELGNDLETHLVQVEKVQDEEESESETPPRSSFKQLIDHNELEEGLNSSQPDDTGDGNRPLDSQEKKEKLAASSQKGSVVAGDESMEVDELADEDDEETFRIVQDTIDSSQALLSQHKTSEESLRSPQIENSEPLPNPPTISNPLNDTSSSPKSVFVTAPSQPERVPSLTWSQMNGTQACKELGVVMSEVIGDSSGSINGQKESENISVS